MKKIIKTLLVLLLFTSTTQIIKALSFGSSVYSGSGEALTIPTNITSWHPASGPYGIRVSLVNTSNGRRVTGSISVDYSDFEGLEGFGYFSASKKSKLDYISNNSSILNINNLIVPTSATNQYRYVLLNNSSLPKLLTANKANANTNIREYFRSEYSPVNKKANFIQLLTELSAGTPFINSVNAVSNGNYTNVFNTYNYSLVVEPILYFALRSDNAYGSQSRYATYVAATATEAALLLNNVNSAGNIKSISHISLPRSLNVDSTVFSGSSLQITALGTGQATSTTLLNSNDIYAKTGYGLSVIRLSDITANSTPYNSYATNSVSTNPYAMSVVENGSSVLASQINAYRTVSCAENMTANFPSASYKLKAGTHFVFEPIETTGTKTCNASIDIDRLINDYNNKATETRNAYDAYIKAKARYDTWAAKKNRTVVGECNIKYNVSKTTAPDTLTITGFPNVSGGFEVYNATKVIPPTAYKHSFQYILTSSSWFANTKYIANNQTYALVDYRTSYGRSGAGPTVMVMGIPPSSYYISNSYPLEYIKADIMLPYIRIAYRDRGNPVQTKLLLKYVLPKTSCGGTAIYDYGEAGTTKSICIDYDSWYSQQGFFDGADVCYLNTGNTCTKETYTYTRTSNNSYNWWYGYTKADGTYTTVRPNNTEVTNTCQTATMPSYTSLYNTYIARRDELSSLETILRSIGGWTTDAGTGFANDAELSITTNDNSGVNTYTSFDISKSTTQNVISTISRGSVATYNDLGVRDGGSISVSSIPTSLATIVNKKYNLSANTNRYILKDTGAVVSSLPSKYTAGGTLAGYYTDLGYPNYKVGITAAGGTGTGTITISYRNLGSTSYKLDKTLADSIPRAGFVNGNYFTYQSTYSVEGGILDPTGKLNLVYRQIDLTNPFPYFANTETTTEREPGFNWRIKTSSVADIITGPGTDIYAGQPMYVIDFTGANKTYIQTIKRYNNTNNYNYTMKCNGTDAYGNNNGTQCRSTYLGTLKSAGIISGCGTDVSWNSCGI